jgi:tRNA-Thr(GGU) m(6)t(6)A37 methyltransferase TsaA
VTTGGGLRSAARPATGARSRGIEVDVQFERIGTIRSPFTDPSGMPIQPPGAGGVKGTIEILAEYTAGLKDLDGFSHIILLYLFHRSEGYELEVIPFLDSRPHGVFATRAPRRPNPIGLSVVRLERVVNGVLHVDGIDVLDGTPLLDIKPYVPDFDACAEARTGWLAAVSNEAKNKRSDDRFA